MTKHKSFVACKQEETEPVQSWQKFQRYSCYKMAQSHSTLVHQNFRLLWLSI